MSALLPPIVRLARAALLAVSVCAVASSAAAQTDFRPQWKDAGPEKTPAARPEYRAPEAPRTLPTLPQPALHPTANDAHTGLALGGFDPVAYFTDRKAVTGTAELETVVNGETWRFAQVANQKIFTARPDQFRPRFGGFDAESVARGAVVNADPTIFLIVGDALYLFRTAEARSAFASQPEMQAQAEAKWPSIKGDTIR
ncbi:MAG: YHS domain-containing (seleno)protein [Beijerinckiaceae bacterium]